MNREIALRILLIPAHHLNSELNRLLSKVLLAHIVEHQHMRIVVVEHKRRFRLDSYHRGKATVPWATTLVIDAELSYKVNRGVLFVDENVESEHLRE